MTSPFALTVFGDPQDGLRHLIDWFRRERRLDDIVWTMEDLDSAATSSLVQGDTLTTEGLTALLQHQVIELEIVGRVDGVDTWRILIRDGVSLDLLGHGEIPTPFELGARYQVVDAAFFGWG